MRLHKLIGLIKQCTWSQNDHFKIYDVQITVSKIKEIVLKK